MNKKTVLGWASAFALACAAPVEAATIDYAFDKTGATPDQVVSDMQTCATDAARVRMPTGSIVGSTLAGGLLAGAAVGPWKACSARIRFRPPPTCACSASATAACP